MLALLAETVSLEGKEVAPVKSDFATEYWKHYYQQLNDCSPILKPLSSMRLCAFAKKEAVALDAKAIVACFVENRDSVRPSQELIKLNKKSCPIISLVAVPTLESLRSKVKRKFSSNQHDVEVGVQVRLHHDSPEKPGVSKELSRMERAFRGIHFKGQS